jgi:plasmid maintenance system antidote protein VapI
MNEFNPNWVSPPGHTIRDILAETDTKELILAIALGISLRSLKGLLRGEILLTKDLAERLEKILGATEVFWLEREFQYREGLKNGKIDLARDPRPIQEVIQEIGDEVPIEEWKKLDDVRGGSHE